ncbi:beta-xylosidase [Saccharopolyspora erythraea]|uniref:beta-xylosidase n=1 Tax=Saccharopolyspora erythraea TaxID=1836 RepID=UPI001BA7943F|nr:beta-xylosidase [Saccharopolyspora erythraea]QUH01606.1 beta-xylosidase [Saccharopolyspora erythraea]
MIERASPRGRGNRLRRALLALSATALLASCTTVEGSPGPLDEPTSPAPPPSATLTTSAARESAAVVLAGGQPAPYNYGPTVVAEDGRYRAWWCSQLPDVGPAGDDVLHAASADLGTPFTADGGAPAVPVFSGQPGGFDAMHTCDPSVVRAGGRYHLYYTGAAGDHAHGNAIGVASSADGMSWRREAGGRPVVTASGDVVRANVYGAGQPSALFLDGWFYLMFTDTTAAGAGWNGAGQFVLRAKDATFTDRVQALTDRGFQPASATRGSRARSVVDAFSADLMWVEALDAFAIAHQTAAGTTVTFWDRDFTRHPYRPLIIPGVWQEGPGLVRDPGGRAPVSAKDPCGVVPVDVLRATALNPAPTDIRRFGLDVVDVEACESPRRARAVLDGFGVPSPARTVDVVRDGGKIRVERRSVAEKMARGVLDERVPALDDLPVVATIRAQAPALRAPDGEVGLLDDRGRLWTVPVEAVEANGSQLREVSQQEWDAASGR